MLSANNHPLSDTSSTINNRNFVGYGQYPPENYVWPEGKKLAISFVVNYEEGGENVILNGDEASEVFLNETPNGTPRKGQRDMNMESIFEYGARCGVWRIMRMFQDRGLKFTCYAVGRAVELNPEVIRAMEEQGHEIASHNYRWYDYQNISDKEVSTQVGLTIEAIKRASPTGRAPVGWYTGRIGETTRECVIRECRQRGIDLLYDSDAYNDDLPYWVKVDNKDHLVIPYTLDVNDMKFSVPPGFTSGEGFFQYLKDTFDVLYSEATHASHPNPKMMSVGLHCRLVGRPGRAAALARFLDYIQQFSDVWVATREEIAQHWWMYHSNSKQESYVDY